MVIEKKKDLSDESNFDISELVEQLHSVCLRKIQEHKERLVKLRQMIKDIEKHQQESEQFFSSKQKLSLPSFISLSAKFLEELGDEKLHLEEKVL